MDSDRKAFDEAVVAMSLSSSKYSKHYVFYMHLLAQCKVVFDKTLNSCAGVTFKNNSYVLYLNPSDVVTQTSGDSEVTMPGFNTNMPLEHRIGILKHEMLHIILGHIIRAKMHKAQPLAYNYAADCALNQEIDSKHLPDGAIYPHNLPTKEENVKKHESAEYYYTLLDVKELDKPDKSSNVIDDHTVWEDSDFDSELLTEVTKNMVENAAEATKKANGQLPKNINTIIDKLTATKKVSWKQLLKNILTSQKAAIKKTITRPNRRLPNAVWLKGKTKNRIPKIAIISDTSGSVSNKELKAIWQELLNLCSTFNSNIPLVQVDSEATQPETLKPNLNVITRKSNGGTFLSKGIEKFKQTNIDYDVLIVTSDGYLAQNDINIFNKLNKPVIWLLTTNANNTSFNIGKMKSVLLEN